MIHQSQERYKYPNNYMGWIMDGTAPTPPQDPIWQTYSSFSFLFLSCSTTTIEKNNKKMVTPFLSSDGAANQMRIVSAPPVCFSMSCACITQRSANRSITRHAEDRIVLYSRDRSISQNRIEAAPFLFCIQIREAQTSSSSI